MLHLIKIELLKFKYGKNKFILIISSLIMILMPTALINILGGDIDRNFISLYKTFFDVNYQLIIPVCIGVFTLSNISNEFKNKTIKNLIMSGYSKTKIIISKYIVILLLSITSFSLSSGIYAIISYNLSDKSQIYFNFKAVTWSELVLNIVGSNIIILFYISAIVAFSFMLGILLKKQGISILIYIIFMTFVSAILSSLQGTAGFRISQFIFTVLSAKNYIGVEGYEYSKFISIIPCLSNMFLFLAISDLGFKKYKF